MDTSLHTLNIQCNNNYEVCDLIAIQRKKKDQYQGQYNWHIVLFLNSFTSFYNKNYKTGHLDIESLILDVQ